MSEKLKLLFLSMIVAAVFFGCLGMQIPPEDPVCPQDESWICEQSEKLKVAPETVYGWIYSAVAIGAIGDIVEIRELCNFEKKIADFYVRTYPMSYSHLIDEALRQANLKSPEKAMLIKNVLNRNLVQYKSTRIISKADDAILRKGHAAFREDMLCFD